MAESSEQPTPREPHPVPSKEAETTIAGFREKRLVMWKSMVDTMKKHPNVSRVLSAAVNATVGSYVKLSAEAYTGKTVDQQNLTPLGRIVHAFIVGTGLASYGLVAAGRPEIAAVAYGSSWAAYALMYGPEIIAPTLRAAAKGIEANHKTTASILRTVADVAEKPKKLFFTV